ncbi:Dehydrodolichyl diphosphate synthase CPT5, chloroplastic-like protein [Drosera capensis]
MTGKELENGGAAPVEKAVKLPAGLHPDQPLPEHVAFIMDGNRRWARQRGLPPEMGYVTAVRTLSAIIELCVEWKIKAATCYTFSTENWGRPGEEIDFLMKLIEKTLAEKVETYMRQVIPKPNCAFPCCFLFCTPIHMLCTSKFCLQLHIWKGVRTSVIGDTTQLPQSLQDAIKSTEEITKNNTNFHMVLAISYSGQEEITDACRSLCEKVKAGLIEPKDVTKSLIEQQLQTNIMKFPNPDLLVRTGGDIRISNFLLWQTAYSELYFEEKLWPDLTEEDFTKALISFQQRKRRFGK